MNVRIGLLRMDSLPEHGLHVGGDYPALYELMFAHQPVELVDIPVFLGEAPSSLDDCDGWVMTGSRYSVYDDHDWIRTGEAIIRASIAAERPFVGICFGHQLMAQALGGRSGQAEVGWSIGAKRYEVTHAMPWLEGVPSYTLVASHKDQVLETPPEATVWARTEGCPIAGLAVGERAWSIQGHPEFTADVAEALYKGRIEKLGADAVGRAVESLSQPLDNRLVAAAIVEFIRSP